MSTTTAIAFGAMFCAACCVIAYFRGHDKGHALGHKRGREVGEILGRNLQRVEDIQEQWAREDRRRDPRTGKFRSETNHVQNQMEIGGG